MKGGKVFLFLMLTMSMASCSILAPKRQPNYRASAVEDIAPEGYTPRGTIKEVIYSTTVPGPTYRRMIVYLPEGYYESDRRYPVVYLLHGAHGYETSWMTKGNAIRITDSLTVSGQAVPAIIVTPNMNQYDDNADMDGSRRKDAIESLCEIDGTVESSFVNDIVKYVDCTFRTIPDKKHRAIAGMSIGGLQSLHISAANPNVFGYVGLFSPLTKAFIKPSNYNGIYKSQKEKIENQFDEEPGEYIIMIGRQDVLLADNLNYDRYLTRKEYRHEFHVTSGGHEWNHWQRDYCYFIQQIFK